VPHATSSLHRLPPGVDGRDAVMLSDIFPTGLECGVLNGRVQPGGTVAIIGTGPVGLAALMTAQLYSPALVVAIDTNNTRLAVAEKLGAHHTVNPAAGDVREKINTLTDGQGCDTVIEAVGVPETFELCQELVAAGGTIANVGVHGSKVDLHLERLWDRNISITTRLVDAVSTPMLLKLLRAGRIDVSPLITHDFAFSELEKAYDTFKAAEDHGALKVLINTDG